MRQLRQLLSIALVLVLLFPSMVFANAPMFSEEVQQSLIDELPEDSQEVVVTPLEGEELEKLRKPEEDPTFIEELEALDSKEDVRVLIELHQEPVINVATTMGISVSDMSQGSYDSAVANVVREQESIESTLESLDAKFVEDSSFQVVINGMTAEVPYENIEKIKELPEVKNVYILHEYHRPEPMMRGSVDMVHAPEAWNLSGLKGEGAVIAVIDSGVDVNHKDWNITDPSKVKLTKEDVDALGLNGVYHSEKIPYMYDYYDKKEDTFEGGSSHGMHVAGTIAANGEIKGVAPEAQILAMKVFSSDTQLSTVFSDIYIKAMEDAAKLGADAVNLSLGSPAGIWQRDGLGAENVTINNLRANGVVSVIAGGNDRTITDGYETPMDGNNPDIGTVGSPAINENTLSVASIDNVTQSLTALIATIDGEDHTYPMLVNADAPTGEGPFEPVYGGEGTPDEIPAEVEDKAALIVRGNISFAEKIQNAEDKGAAAVIIYNHASGGDVAPGMDLGGFKPSVPVISMGYSDGNAIKEALDAKSDVSVRFSYELQSFESPTGYQISGFSSWGPSADLRMKPEITAPGGGINSTQPGNSYGNMSGTSMATPHVAGGVGVVHQALKQNWGLAGEELATLSKTILMNTAVPVSHPTEGYPYSVMEQGAGLMNVAAAVTTPVYVTATGTNDEVADAKLELKDNFGTTFNYTLNLTNKSDEEVEYTLSADAQTQAIEDGLFTETSQVLEAEHNAEGTVVTVPANGTTSVSGTITVSAAPVNQYLNGFITLKSDANVDLSIPYLGFNGDWGEPNIFDNRVDEVYDDGPSFFGWAELYGFNDGWYHLPLHDEQIEEEYVKFVGPNRLPNPVYSLLRNTELIKHSIVDAETDSELSIVNNEYQIRKINRIYAGAQPYRLNGANTWNGMIRGKEPVDGKLYYYNDTAWLNYDAEPQVVTHPIVWDSLPPELVSVEYDAVNNAIQVTPNDLHAGTEVAAAFSTEFKQLGLGFVSEIETPLPGRWTRLSEENEPVTVPLGDFQGDSLILLLADRVGNQALWNVTLPKAARPEITISEPGLLYAFNVDSVPVAGAITGTEIVDRVVVELLNYETAEVIGEPVEATVTQVATDRFTFKVDEFPFGPEDGPFSIRATAYSGPHKNAVSTHIIVDREAPEVELTAVTETTNANETITIDMSDNYWFFLVEEVFGSVTEQIEILEDPGIPIFAAKFTEHTSEKDVPLEMGENTLTFRVTDIAGNVAEESIVITRVEEQVDPETPTEPEDPEVDKSELEKKLEEAEAIDQENYEDGLEELNAAIEKANEVLADEDATQAEVDAAVKALEDAIAGLVEKEEEPDPEVDKSELEKKLKEAEAIDQENYKDGLEELNAAIKKAREVLADAEATQAEVNAAVKALEDAMNGLVKKDPPKPDPKPEPKPDPKPEPKPTTPLIERVHGKNRILTSVEISKEYFNKADEVIIASSVEFADALVANSYAAMLDAPILLTEKAELDPAVVSEIERLGAKKAIVVGGTFRISEEVVTALDKDLEVERISGKTRYETAINIAERVMEINPDATPLLANGERFADALAGNTIAVAEDAPILITPAKELHSTVKTFLDEHDVNKLIVLGGKIALSNDVNRALQADDLEIIRLKGATRYHTALEVAKYQYKKPINVFLATGRNFADALSAGPVLKDDGALLLVDYNTLLPEVKEYIKNAETITIVGGTQAINIDLKF